MCQDELLNHSVLPYMTRLQGMSVEPRNQEAVRQILDNSSANTVHQMEPTMLEPHPTHSDQYLTTNRAPPTPSTEAEATPTSIPSYAEIPDYGREMNTPAQSGHHPQNNAATQDSTNISGNIFGDKPFRPRSGPSVQGRGGAARRMRGDTRSGIVRVARATFSLNSDGVPPFNFSTFCNGFAGRWKLLPCYYRHTMCRTSIILLDHEEDLHSCYRVVANGFKGCP